MLQNITFIILKFSLRHGGSCCVDQWGYPARTGGDSPLYACLPPSLWPSIIISLAMTLSFFLSSLRVFPWILTQFTIPLSILASHKLLSQTPTWFLFNILSCSLLSPQSVLVLGTKDIQRLWFSVLEGLCWTWWVRSRPTNAHRALNPPVSWAPWCLCTPCISAEQCHN